MRKPDVVIRDQYLLRWHLIPRNRWFNIYLHKFIGSDDDMPHDHPWDSFSILLKGRVMEAVFKGDDVKWVYPRRFVPYFRRAEHVHIVSILRTPTWTLFITGPKRREWGFHTARGFVRWDKYLGER